MRFQIHLKRHIRPGFSLIELLLVIFIVALVYYLGFSTVQKEKKRAVLLSPMNLRSAVMQNNTSGTFICTGNCKTCYFRKDISTPFEPYSGKSDLKNIKVYILNTNDQLVPTEFGRYRGEKICLSMHFYPNGSTTPLVIENKKGIYFLPSYFGDTQKVASLEEAHILWTKEQNALGQSGAFY